MGKETYIIIKKKRQKSVDVFYRRYGKRLLSYALKNWKTDEDTAWELIYKTLDTVIDKIDNYAFESEKKFSAFVYLSFLNNLRNHFRNKNNRIQTIHDPNIEALPESIQNDNATEDSDQMKSLKDALSGLKDWERMLLLLRAQKMPYNEIAKYVNKPKDQLKVYHARLKQKITEQIKPKKEVYHG